jgi:hypothetical protein
MRVTGLFGRRGFIQATGFALGTNRHQLWHVMHALLTLPARRDV